MISNIKERTSPPLSFITSLSGYISQLAETLEHQHKLFKKIRSLNAEVINKALIQVTKNSESILLFREQLHRWKQKAQSQGQQKQIDILELKLSQVARLNSKLYELINLYEEV